MTNDIAEILRDKIETLPFVDRIAGLVKALTISEETDSGKKRKTFPVACNVSQADCMAGAYQDLVPDSAKKSVIYFEEAGGTQMLGFDGPKMKFRSNLRLVGWLNLKKMGLTDCGWSSTAVLQIIRELSDYTQPSNHNNKFIHLKITGISEAEKSAAIFSRYTYDETVTQYLIYPYDYFALNISVEFFVNKNCIEDAEIPDIEICDENTGEVENPSPTVGHCWDLLRWNCDTNMWVRWQAPTTSGVYNITVNKDGSLSFTQVTGGGITILKLTESDFTGQDYQNDLLIGKTADIGFLLFSDSGSGTLMKVNDGYSFNATTGTITELFTVGNYRLQIF